MEKKKFFEVFQDLRLDQDISDLFEYVNVTRITANKIGRASCRERVSSPV